MSNDDFEPDDLHYYWKQVCSNLIIIKSLDDEVNCIDKYFDVYILKYLDDNYRARVLKILEGIRSIYQQNNFITGEGSSKVSDGFKYYNISQENENLIKGYFNELKSIFETIEHIDFFISIQERVDRSIEYSKKIYKQKADELLGEINSQSLYGIFATQKEEFSEKIKVNTKFYYVLITFMGIISFLFILFSISNNVISFCICNKFIFYKFTLMSNSIDLKKMIFYKINLLIPFLLIIYFVLNKIKQDRILEQSYLHKKLVAQSYVFYSEEFGNRRDKRDTAIQENLLNITINVLEQNPALLLNKSTAEQIPNEKMIEKVIDFTTKNNKG